ncbi:MAG: hypothetical protein ACJA00_002618 [Myxococcota bacterium]|jgi:hypothetical protein
MDCRVTEASSDVGGAGSSASAEQPVSETAMGSKSDVKRMVNLGEALNVSLALVAFYLWVSNV